MMNVPEFAPGCFGSAIAFKEEDVICRGCSLVEQCRPAHLHAKALLQERLGISPAERPAPKKAASPAPVDPTTLTLPQKTRELLDRLDRGHYAINEKLGCGENPFSDAMPFMRVACHVLLHISRPVNRELLAAAFVKKLGWQQNTADAHARLAIQALTHVGAVENRDGLIMLRGRSWE